MRGWQRWLRVNDRIGELGRSTLLSTTSLGTRAIIQAAYLLIVSRWLGAEGYGLFAGSVALLTLGAPLANWGSSLLLARYIAQDRNSSRAMWATALVQTGIIGSLLIIGMLIISSLILQQSLPLGPMLMLALAELILLPAAQAATSQCYALEHSTASAVSICLVPLGRILLIISSVASGVAGTPEHAATAHFIGSGLGLAAAVALVARIDGLPAWRSRLSFCKATRQGTAYAISNTAGTGYQEVDKILMLQLLGAAVVGPYTVAFRITSILVLPITALISATLPRLISQHLNSSTPRTYRTLLYVALGYGGLAGMAMLIAAPVAPYLFGPGYEQTSRYLLLLAPWPMLFALRQCLATKLTASNYQLLRSTAETTGLILAIALNIILLPRIGEAGSALSLLATEVTISIVLWTLIHKKYREDQTN